MPGNNHVCWSSTGEQIFFFKDNLYTEIPLSNSEKQNANADYKMDSAQKHDAKCKKPDTKGHMLYAFQETFC